MESAVPVPVIISEMFSKDEYPDDQILRQCSHLVKENENKNRQCKRMTKSDDCLCYQHKPDFPKITYYMISGSDDDSEYTVSEDEEDYEESLSSETESEASSETASETSRETESETSRETTRPKISVFAQPIPFPEELAEMFCLDEVESPREIPLIRQDDLESDSLMIKFSKMIGL